MAHHDVNNNNVSHFDSAPCREELGMAHNSSSERPFSQICLNIYDYQLF